MLLPQKSIRSTNLVDRMPMSFGKRHMEESDLLPPGTNMAVPCRDGDSTGGCMDSIMGGKIPDRPRYPLSAWRNLLTQNAGGFLRNTRGRLERMPLTFGKRTPEVDNAVAPLHKSETFTVSARNMLDRMPNYYGKRKRSFPSPRLSPSAQVDPLSTEDGRLGDMANFVSGVRGHYKPLEEVNEGQGAEMAESKRWSRMDRMPLTYGKRGYTEDSPSHIALELGFPRLFHPAILNQFGNSFRRMRRGQVETEKLRSLLPEVLRAAHAQKDGESAALKESEEQFAQGTPQGQGHSIFPLQMLRTNGLKRSAKDDVVYVDLPYLMHQLREQKSKMSPEEYKLFQANAQSVLQRYLLFDTPLTRSSRSRLGRMPLTYGKRSHPGPAANDNKNRFAAGRFPAQSWVMLPPTRRSRMDRMPLSFGKRVSASGGHLGHEETAGRAEFESLGPFTGRTSGDSPEPSGPLLQAWSRDGGERSAEENQDDTEDGSGLPALPPSAGEGGLSGSDDVTIGGAHISSLSQNEFINLGEP
ncbi:hypothetical protein EGW08_017527 [Elysia chlorotica]|uniref:Uncharacterized protein n=1 Tax=Elysia chlorotica TaxID=188477 RepID=A0A3S1B4A1_ELYCH|nr:hypothetical protein EGW08_017527 [Elysia chlorotica]